MRKFLILLIIVLLFTGCGIGNTGKSNDLNSSLEQENTYKVKIHINFTSNLLLSKYDVDVDLDGEKQGTLKHGTDGDYEISLKEGKHTLSFFGTEKSAVSGSAAFNVTGEMGISYKINCHSDRIEVQEERVVNISAISENEAMVPSSAEKYKRKNYEEIVKSFEDAGFTNVSTEILYDIVWGLTEEGESDKVSINGATDFSYGDIFPKDAVVIVTYHLRQEDDPLRPDTSWSESDTSIPEQSEIESNTSTGGSAVKDSGHYRMAFEKYGRNEYPYGFKCHWIMDLRVEKKVNDNTYYFMVGVTITNAFGVERKGVAHGIVVREGSNYYVDTFGVS